MARHSPSDEQATPDASSAWALADPGASCSSSSLWGYYLLFEGLRDGQTPGKRLLGFAPFATAATRSDSRRRRCAISCASSTCSRCSRIWSASTSIALTKSGKRLGDIVAGTIVVREATRQAAGPAGATVSSARRHRRRPPHSSPTPSFNCSNDGPSDATASSPNGGANSTAQVANRASRTPFPTDDGSSDSARCSDCSRSERRAREQGAAARGATGASRERYAIVTTSSPRWIAFAVEARRRAAPRAARRSAKRAFAISSPSTARSPSTSRGCAPRSRGESTRRTVLPRPARRRRAQPALPRPTRRHASRFSASSRSTFRPRCAAPFAPIALAAAFMFGPAIIAYTAVVRDPAVARGLHPDADARSRGRRRSPRAQRATATSPIPQVFRPVMASRIIANNVQVTFGAFAFGITAGLGTLALLLVRTACRSAACSASTRRRTSCRCSSRSSRRTACSSSAPSASPAARGLLIAAALLLPGRTHAPARARRERSRARCACSPRRRCCSRRRLARGLVSPIP